MVIGVLSKASFPYCRAKWCYNRAGFLWNMNDTRVLPRPLLEPGRIVDDVRDAHG